MKIKTFFLIVCAGALFFTMNAMANLPEKESVTAVKAEMHQFKKSNPRPFKCTITYNFLVPGIGIGKATHMGFITTHSEFNPISSTGVEKILASDGSELDMIWTWDTTNNTGIWQITGGTGRFEDAKGSGDWSGVFSIDMQFFAISLIGYIIY